MQGAMGAIAYVRGLRVLRIEDLHCRLEHEAVTDLGQLSQVCSTALPYRKLFTLTRHSFRYQPLHSSAISLAEQWEWDATVPKVCMPGSVNTVPSAIWDSHVASQNVSNDSRPQDSLSRVPHCWPPVSACVGMQLEELAITGEEHVHPNSWAIGLSSVPDSWRNMKRLKRLQLQGHTILEVGSSGTVLSLALQQR